MARTMCRLDTTCHVATAARVLSRWPPLGVLRVVLPVIRVVLPRRPQAFRLRRRRTHHRRPASISSTVEREPAISKQSKSSLSYHGCIELMLLLIVLLRPFLLPIRYDYSLDSSWASLVFVHGYASTTFTSRSRKGWNVKRHSSFSKYSVGCEPLRQFGVDKTQDRRVVRLDASRDFGDDDDDDDDVAKTDATPRGDTAVRATNAATAAGTAAPPRRRVVVPSTSSSTTARQRPYWEGNDIADDDDAFDYLDDDTAATATTEASNSVDSNVLEWEKCLVSVPNIDRRRRFSSDSRRRNNIADPESSSSMTTSTCWVLLPPLSVSLPTAIVHFVGGTVTGSAPHVWYDTLLTDIVRQSNCAVVASTIPVTTGLLDGGQSPLDHVRLALLLQQQFCTAYETILVDEYGDGLDKLNDSSSSSTDGTATALLHNVPICGLGHSLGARLLVVLATLQDPQSAKATTTKSMNSPSFDINYKALVLMSFTNFGAGVGIPGLAQLYRASRRLENDEQKSRSPPPRPRDPNRRNVEDDTNGYYDDRNEEDDDDDVILSDLWNDLTTTLQQGAARVQSTLTPSTDALEFFPSPEQLWKAIEVDGRYTNVIRQTLVVQFDNDDVDQSSRLATAILQGQQRDGDAATSATANVKFARLRGTHLTPISFANDNNNRRGYGRSGNWFQSVNDQAGRLLLKLLQNNGSKQRGQQAEALLELRQSIVRYIIEIVAKD